MYFYYSLYLHLFCRDFVVMSTNGSKLTNGQKNKPAVPPPSGKFSMTDYIIMAIIVVNIFSIIKTWYSNSFDQAKVLIILFILSFFILYLVNLGKKYMDKNSGNGILKVLIGIIVLLQFPLIIFAAGSMLYIFIKGIFF